MAKSDDLHSALKVRHRICSHMASSIVYVSSLAL